MPSKYPKKFTVVQTGRVWTAKAEGYTVCGAGGTADNAIRDWKRQRLKQVRRGDSGSMRNE